MRVLALMGFPRTGKNTLAEVLRRTLPGRVEIAELTTPAKEFVATVSGVRGDSLKDIPLGEGKCTPRKLIIELMSVVDRELGLEWFQTYLESFREKCDWLIIPGIRTAAQVTWAKKNGHVVYVSRPGLRTDPEKLSSIDREIFSFVGDADRAMTIEENPDWLRVARGIQLSVQGELDMKQLIHDFHMDLIERRKK